MGVQGLARFIYTLAVGRLMGPEPLGEVSAILSLAVYFSLFWPAAAGIGASRFLPLGLEGPAYLSALKRSFFRAAAVLTGLAFPLAWWMTGNAIAALLASALVFSYAAYVFVRGALLGDDRYIRATVLDGVSSAVAIGLLVAVLLGGLAPILLLPLAVGYGLFAVIGWPRHARVDLDDTKTRALRRFLIHTSIGTLATGGLLPATMVFVQGFDTDHAAGLFAAGLSLATPANLLAQALAQVLVPHFSRIHHTDSRAVAHSYTRIFFVSSAAFVVIFGVLIAGAGLLLVVAYGAQYSGGTFATQALLAVVFAISCSSVPTALLVATGHERLNSRVWLVAFAVGTLLMAGLAPAMGVTGALIGFAVGGGAGSLGVIASGFVMARSETHSAAHDQPTTPS